MTQNYQPERELVKAYDDWADSLFRFCYFKTSDREVAKDLVQQTFLKAWAYIRQGNEIKNIKAFLYHIANNIVIDWYRQPKTSSLEAMEEVGLNQRDEKVDQIKEAEFEWILGVVKQLEPDEQDLIIWHYIEDLSSSTVAKMIGVKENTVAVRLHRALKHLKSLLNK